MLKTKQQIIDEVVQVCKECKAWYKEIADAGKLYKKEYINARVNINDTDYIFIDCDCDDENLNYFWFSLESELYPYTNIDEQDTTDTSEKSIRYNVGLLLENNY